MGVSDSWPLVAIVGRPNVGKSTLFNRVCGGHDAIVEDEAGVTRDRRYGEAEWDGFLFRVVDTGGLDFDAAKPDDATLQRGILKQAMRAVAEAAVVLFVVDARTGLVPEDRDAIKSLRKSGKPILWVANKVDGAKFEAEANELYALGADQVFPISAQHGRGVGELLDAVVAKLPEAPRIDEQPEAEDDETRPIKLALVGRPNAGKSSLVNRLVGDERVIVDALAGTTRDPVDTPVEIAGRRYVLIDTAGIRRRSKVYVPMEKIAVAMAEKAVGRCDVCVLVVDAEEGLAEQDAKVAGMCEEAGRALVILFNKLDLVDEKQQKKLHEDLKRQLQFVPWARVVFASAKTGKGVQRVLDAVQAAYAAYTRRVSTGALNRWFEGIVERHPPSVYRGHPIKLYFIQQPQAKPPTFLLSVNFPEGLHFSYRRYLSNQLRDEFDLWGTPVRIVAKARGQKPRMRRGAGASERSPKTGRAPRGR
jgi:GTP-binding protein